MGGCNRLFLGLLPTAGVGSARLDDQYKLARFVHRPAGSRPPVDCMQFAEGALGENGERRRRWRLGAEVTGKKTGGGHFDWRRALRCASEPSQSHALGAGCPGVGSLGESAVHGGRRLDCIDRRALAQLPNSQGRAGAAKVEQRRGGTLMLGANRSTASGGVDRKPPVTTPHGRCGAGNDCGPERDGPPRGIRRRAVDLNPEMVATTTRWESRRGACPFLVHSGCKYLAHRLHHAAAVSRLRHTRDRAYRHPVPPSPDDRDPLTREHAAYSS